MLGRQNPAFIYLDKIIRIQIGQFNFFLIFILLPIKNGASYCQLITFQLNADEFAFKRGKNLLKKSICHFEYL